MQYPHFLLHKYFGVSVGHIVYFPPNLKLLPGFNAQDIRLPHPGVSLVLGHEFNKFVSAEISYMRPVDWILYRNVNGDMQQHSVWTNVLGLTVITHIQVLNKLSVFGKAGIGYITQTGFKVNNQIAVKDENYIDFLLGTGIRYQVNNKWALNISGLIPTSTKNFQAPYKIFYSAGLTYSVTKLPQTKSTAKTEKNNFLFPKNMIQAGFATNTLGYAVNAFAEKTYIFWGGDVEIKNGFTVLYQRNIFHTRKVFSLSWRVGADGRPCRRPGSKRGAASTVGSLRLPDLSLSWGRTPAQLRVLYRGFDGEGRQGRARDVRHACRCTGVV